MDIPLQSIYATHITKITYWNQHKLHMYELHMYEQIIIKSFARSNHFIPYKKASSETAAIS